MVLVAKVLLFLQIVVIAAAAGAVFAFFGLIFVSTLLGASNMEGGLAMGAAGLAPVGAVIGAALGAWFAWRTIGRMSKAAVLAGGFGLAVLAALTDGDPYPTDAEPTVLIEWRLPEAVRHDWVDGIFRFAMRSSYQDWPLTTHWQEQRARDEDGRTILRLRTKIRWRVIGRIFQLWRAPAHDDRITVDLGLPRDPKPTAEYGPWREVDGAPGNAYRIRVISE